MTIRLLTFDLDDTLWPVGPLIGRAEHRMRDLLDREFPALHRRFDREQFSSLRQEIVAADPQSSFRLSDLRRKTLRLALERCEHPDPEELAERAYLAFMDARHDVEYFEDALDTLTHLARHYTLGALSNGNADIPRLGLDRYFDFHLNAETVGAPKPEAAMFDAALQQAGVGPEAAVHIGDHPRDDIRGAGALGIRTVWVNRPGVPWDYDRVRPTWEITELGELRGLFPG